MSAFLVDTRGLISLADPARPHHAAAVAYFREALRQGVPLYLSAIAASEFQVKQAVTDLPMRNFEVLPFNIDHAMQAGLLMRLIKRDVADDRAVVKDDVKLIAQAICESLTHIVTEDARTLVKYLQRLNAAGECAIQPCGGACRREGLGGQTVASEAERNSSVTEQRAKRCPI